MSLLVYNSMTRQKEEFVPIIPGYVGMYVCGPTVYSHSHVGHAKSYVSFDVVARYLRYLDYKVLYIQNITDVGHLTDDADEGEDKLVRQARYERVHPMQIAETIMRSYFEDMDALNIIRPDISPRASGHIPEQIELIERLIERGYAYVVDGSVYYDVQKFPEYGKLSGRSIDEAVEGTRVELRSEKRHPADFALWKKAEKGHIMRWKSPWGEGFPGWHIECSAMSMKYLGESFDIHGGGMDNRFPHHECEIAQSEGTTGKPFVKYWLHNNLVTINGQKMSKSLGNFITLKELFQKYKPGVVRFLILQSHYRSTLDFSDGALQAAKSGYEKYMNALSNLHLAIQKASDESGAQELPFDLQAYEARFCEAMNDDFNTPQALATLFDLTKETNQILNLDRSFNKVALQNIENVFQKLGENVLGITLESRSTQIGEREVETQLVDLLVTMRSEIRKQKLWNLSDEIRDKLLELGYILEDKKEGTTWRRII